MKTDDDTITAIATPAGFGGVGIVRISGPNAKLIAESVCRGVTCAPEGIYRDLKPREALFTSFFDQHNDLIDHGIALYFQHPHSFTGEDVVELQGHGGPIVMDRLLQTVIAHGARLARPGEFTERAFLNKKIDLVQAEAIADLIAANSVQAARSAARSLQGVFSQKIHALQKSLTTLRMQIEAMLDFPEEDIDFMAQSSLQDLLQQTIDAVKHVKNEAKQGVLLQSGLNVVIAGKPNVGKSSLFNYLSGRESAIVTHIPGTTRDVLRESIQIDGMPLHIIDTAGLRDTTDVVEQEGVRRATAQMNQADLILLVTDASDSHTHTHTHTHMLVIRNKIDLTHEKPCVKHDNHQTIIQVSVKNNQGLDLLIDEIKKIAGFQSEETSGFIARRRHVDAIDRAYQILLHGQQQLMQHKAGELLAEDLRLAQHTLSEITGEFSSDDLLGKIFSSFCIGK